jgi:hypothetical protein
MFIKPHCQFLAGPEAFATFAYPVALDVLRVEEI